MMAWTGATRRKLRPRPVGPVRISFPAPPRAAFTLLELLVVVAIIGVLAVLLLPALGRSKALAHQSQCLANTRQLALALEMYGADNTQQLPPNLDGLIGRERVASWVYGNMADPGDRTNRTSLTDPARSLLARYVPDARIYKCPADRSPAVRSMSLNCRINPIRMGNPPRWLGGGGTNYPVFRRFGDLRHPAATFTFVDEHEALINDGYFAVDLSNTGHPEGQGTPTPYVVIDFPTTRHGEGASFAFADGHVELRRWRDALRSRRDVSPGLWVPPTSRDARWLQEASVGQLAPER